MRMPSSWSCLIASGVLHDGVFGEIARRYEAETARRAASEHVLHVQRLAGAQQRAIEDRMRRDQTAFPLEREIEPPVLDAFVPVGLDKRHVVVQPRAHEEHFLPFVPRALGKIGLLRKLSSPR